jgi:arylformamidase
MSKQRIIDVSMTLQEPMRGYGKSVAKTIEKDGWNASTLEIYSHAGTHMDAPLHFDVNENGIDDIAADRFICQCHILRLAPADSKMLITIDNLGSIRDHIKPGEGIIFHTGWSKFKDDPSIYRDKLPRISQELAQWISDQKVNIVGVEPPSIADVNNLDELQTVHRILLEGDVLILEGLCNLEAVKKDYVKLIALPLKIGQGDGAPVRALIIEE